MAYIAFIIMASLAINSYGQITNQQYDWTAMLRVVDQNGDPVRGAKAGVGNGVSKLNISGVTDKNGLFVASHRNAIENLAVYAEKTGYYPFQMTLHRDPVHTPDVLSSTQTLILKKVIKPIAMYAKSVRTHVPELGKRIGYDLMIGDWITPYGHGNNSDFCFEANFETNIDFIRFILIVSFPNPRDGIQTFVVPHYYLDSPGSALRSSEGAPEAGYQSKWVQESKHVPGMPLNTNRDLYRNYYFRIRTKVDQKGNIVSAHYGKIYGDFMTFTYYMNPTPNDRNVEFDPQQNLLKNLSPMDEVSVP